MVGYSARPVFRCTGITLTPIPEAQRLTAPGVAINAVPLGEEGGIKWSGDLSSVPIARVRERITLDNRRQVLQPAGFVTDAHTPLQQH